MKLRTRPNIEELKILVVDDDENFIELLERKLELHSDREINIDTLTQPREVLEQLRHNYYDVVLVDYHMPEMNGLELLKKVRDENDSIPLIIETNNHRQELEREAFSEGATAIMRKSSEDKHYEGILRNIRHEAQHYRALKQVRE